MKTSVRVAIAGLALLLAAPALAGPDDAESEGQAITRLARSFGKLRGYAMTAEVQGGMAQGPEHRITAQTVNTTYNALVHGTVCKVEAPQQAFRTRQGQSGTISADGKWKAMLSTDEGRLMERLFPRPEDALAECVRMKKLARWVQPEGGQPPAPAPAPEAPTVDADDESAPTGTQSRPTGGDDDQGLTSQVGLSHHLRIVGPATVALEHFIRIQNSGCFSEG
jgi:hypothetical protein